MSADLPLNGIRVLEFAGLAPGPFCGQLLSSYGASVLRLDRPGPAHSDILADYKSSLVVDLKNSASLTVVKSLAAQADVLIDTYRPGVLEKLGLDPHHLLELNPRLIVLRLTGFRRDGKYKDLAGHDINYLAVSGLLNMLGGKELPSPPANVLGDYAGGGLVAFAGVLLAMIRRGVTGRGQVVEANMVDGAGYLGTIPRLRTKEAVWSGPRGTNLLDGGCPYYRCYECKDLGRYVAVGALEKQFFANLVEGLSLSAEDFPELAESRRHDKVNWLRLHELFAKTFKSRVRAEWEAIFDKSDACVTPVLSYDELEEAGYEQRPIVHLQESPSKRVDSQWNGKIMNLGQNGQETLKEWLGWQEVRHYVIQDGKVCVAISGSKL